MLKGLLAKARTKIEAASVQKQKVKAEPKFQQHLDLIVVPQSAIDALPEDPNPLVYSVVNYVNFLFQQAQFNRFEIPTEAIEIYHVDYYLAQVKNGGHAQFVGNSQSVLSYTTADVLSGLMAMNAPDHFAIADAMAKWVSKNPDEAENQTGFEGGIAAELAALDDPFYKLDAQTPLRAKMADWIAGLEILQVIDDDLMPRVLSGIKSLNPNLRDRQAKTRIARLMNQLSNPLFLGLGMAGAAANEIEPVVQVGNGSYRDVDGESTMTWFVKTAKGARFGVVNDTGAVLREHVDPNSDAMPNALENVSLDHVTNFKPVSVGDVVNAVPAAEIDKAKRVCDGVDAAIAIDMLLDRLPEETTADFVSVRSVGSNQQGKIGASIFVVANQAKSAFSAVVEEDGARLLAEPSHKQLARIERAEITKYMDVLKAS